MLNKNVILSCCVVPRHGGEEVEVDILSLKYTMMDSPGPDLSSELRAQTPPSESGRWTVGQLAKRGPAFQGFTLPLALILRRSL